MKRKVKFQEGGAVEEPARRPTPRSRISRMSEAVRNRTAEARAAAQREVERINALRDVEDFNRRVQRGQVDAETMRRMGAEPMPSGRQDFTTSPEGVTRRGTATGREVVPFQEPGAPARPSASRALAEVGTPRQLPLGSPRPRVGGNVATMGGALAMEAAEPLVNYGRRFMERRGAEADARREANLQAFREQQQQEAEPIPPPPPPAPPVPAARSRPTARPAAAAPREISAQRLNELADGAEPANVQESVAQMRMQNRRQELEERGTPFKKGGMVKPKARPVAKKAGGMIAKPKATPKKMMKGGVVAKPKVAVKSKAKPMPFKKGGVIKKGRK